MDDSWFNAPEYGYTGFVPWERANGTPAAGGNGPFDLTRVSEAFWDHFLESCDLAISHGQVIQVKIQPNYYSCASHTVGALWVPDRDQHPRRFNIQGQKLGDPTNDIGIHDFVGTDADVYGNALIGEFKRRCKSYIDKKQMYACTALEMAQKELHVRTRDRLNAGGFGHLKVIANRQEYPTGMWRNMVKNTGFDGNEEHGKRHLPTFLAEVDSNNNPPTRAEMLTEAKAFGPLTVFLNSDGCRIDKDPDSTYDYNALEDVAVYILKEFGGNWSQQSVSKMPPFAWGRVDFGPMDRNELPMLRRIYKRWRG